MQNQLNICPRCQSQIPPDAPGGLCPACVLRGVVGQTNPSQAAAAAAPTMDEVAAAFPDLELIEILGQGGMGIVFKARQPRLDRFVALKVLPPALAAQAGFAERFTREARVLAKLAHSNIVAIYDFGESAGFFYLIMEFVNGVNLRAAMRAGVTPEQALLLVPRICGALQFAHDHGVLHRDIKPENILLDTSGTPKLADFGIAKLANESGASTSLTATGHALGTAAYMAPEQVEKPATVDHRADIYSLGVVLYEMLTGELPLGRFAAPSEKSPVDRGVDEVVLRALEKERERRQQSATDFKAQVEGASQPGLRPPPIAAPAVAMRPQDALVTRILLAICALCAVGIPVIAMLGHAPASRYMVVLTIVFGALAGLSKLFAPPVMVPAPTYVAPPKEKDLGIAYLCWFILGPSGLHKFYLGEIGWGLLYLFTGGLFLIGWIIDLFTLPSQVRRYNEKVRPSQSGAGQSAVPHPLPSGGVPQGALVFIIAIILFGSLVVTIFNKAGGGPTRPSKPAPAAKSAEFRPAAVVTKERPPFIGELTQGSLELVAIAPHPSNDARGWRMDGSSAAEGPFVNRGSTSSAQSGQRAFEFVFRTRNLPVDASTPTWRLSGASGWAGGGHPLLDGKPVDDCEVISAAFKSDLRKTDIHMGIAAGPWHTLSENGPLSQNSSSYSYKGVDWAVTQGSALETKDGETVVTFAHPVRDQWQTRVVAVDAQEKEIAPARSSSFNGQSEWRFQNLPVENIRFFRFQIRPYEWIKFQGVALDPSAKRSTARAAESTKDSDALGDAVIERATRRLKEARAQVEAGVAPAMTLESAELELAVAKARGDQIKIATARVAYAEARSENARKRFEAGIITSAEATEAERDLDIARAQLEQARTRTGIEKDSRAAENPPDL